ncbi:dentin sialophosphoprotein-like [Cucumis melo var. makuwa]|uniref:Dentin sialophosphoprotein-like n=1 Tax=Cucumis melo var. makuwa TaxID=1194695 RepID=A0A5D3BL25_CUCMM|nr:dentin sialophosphoprotein-like [Cucumis melo var. makuwa]TYJ99856.1 dentin sialophosphoprotein-like [Cucumis melo var. makuwa]
MVQRIVANKFGVQSGGGGVKGEKRVASFKTSSSSSSSSQIPDCKNRAADLKKMMKKSRAIQLSEFEISLTSSPVRKNISLPGKPPPNSSNVLEIKQKQNQASVIRTSDGSPNYMKSTSCFDARKEVSQVSSRNSRICGDSKKPRRRNSENSTHASITGLKPTKSLTKSSSMKLVRTLKKAPSFKKSSRVALCADMDSHRATCSSTLKDTKFPAYLVLSPGATEYEGTSALKVCPYTYCSLNGHRHAPLPPLKCFLSARRRLLKNLKVEPSGLGVKGVDDAGGKVLDEEKMVPEVLENDGGLDFFIEVYAENKVDDVGSINQDRVTSGDCAGVSSSTVGYEMKLSSEEDNKPVAENISDGSMEYEVGLGEEVTEGTFFHGDEYEDDAASTDTEMEEWEEQQFLSMENDGLDEVEDQSNAVTEDISEVAHLQNGELAGSGDFVNKKSGNFEEQLYIEDSDLNRHPDWEVEGASQVSESLSFDQLSYLEDEYDEKDATQAVSERDEVEYLEMILNYELEAEVEETLFVTQEASDKEEERQNLQVDRVSDEHCGIHEEVLLLDYQLPNNDLVLQEKLLDADIDNQMESNKQLDDSNHGGEVAIEAENFDGQCQEISATGNSNSVCEEGETESSIVLEMTGNEVPSDLKIEETSMNDNSIVPVDMVEGKDRADSLLKASKVSRNATESSQELDLATKNWEVNPKCKRLGDESEDRDFNPREPNYLPLVPDPEGEKVDLKHQLIDDRKNAEEWMLDYALQRTVTKLAPAKKKKVALLVEAFESVMPTSRYEIHLRNNASGAFTPAKRIQACF